MNRTLAVMIAASVAVAALGGCAANTKPAPSTPPPVAAAPAPAPAQPGGTGGGDNHGRGGGGTALPRTIPADFPADVPLPAGNVMGSTGSAGHWSVLMAETGPADVVQRSTIAFYTAAGFTADSDQVVHRGVYRITVFAVNRDHTNLNNASLTIAVARS
jgi:hypothetical protein